MSFKKLGVSPEEFEKHKSDVTNPHKVNKSQVGLGNVEDVEQASKVEFNSHAGNGNIHVTTAEKSTWNAKETPGGAQTKATKALTDAKLYTDAEIKKIIIPEVSDFETKEGAQARVDEHANNILNPHKVTKSQVGLSNVDNIKQATKAEFDAHTEDKTNPHGVTKAQVGLGSVQNYGLATTAESTTGTSNAKYMTPLRTKEAITNTTGTLSNLKTTTKTDLVSAVNEVFTNGNNVKKNTVDALLSVDDKLPITTTSAWVNIISSISNISTGKKWATINIGLLPYNEPFQVTGLDFVPSVVVTEFVTEPTETETNAKFSAKIGTRWLQGGSGNNIEVSQPTVEGFTVKNTGYGRYHGGVVCHVYE